jgi:type VII secretion protein EccE
MWLSERPRRGRIGGVAVGQLVAAQVAALAVLATFEQSDWVFVPVALAAAAAVGAAFARRDGHWWYEHALLRWRFSRRRATRRAEAARGRAAPLAPGLSVREVSDRGASFGVGLDGEGWYAAVAVLPGPGPRGSLDLSLLRLAGLLQPVDLPVTTVQIGQHRPAAPAAGPAAGMLAGPDQDQVWVALRLDAGAAPAVAADRGGGLDGVHRALATALRRVVKVLRTAGLDGQALDAHGLATTLVEVTGGTGAAEPPVEQWRVWRVGGTGHVCFQLHGQLGAELVEVAARLGQPPVESYTVTVALRAAAPPPRVGPPGAAGGQPLLTGVLRVAAPVAVLDQALARAAELGAWAGMRLRRLDGEHGPAVYAAAPTGKDASGLRAGSSPGPRSVNGPASRSSRTHRRPRRPAAPPQR